MCTYNASGINVSFSSLQGKVAMDVNISLKTAGKMKVELENVPDRTVGTVLKVIDDRAALRAAMLPQRVTNGRQCVLNK